jgi:hypothetical protein
MASLKKVDLNPIVRIDPVVAMTETRNWKIRFPIDPKETRNWLICTINRN